MPFYSWIIRSEETSYRNKLCCCDSDGNENTFDVDTVANKRMVNIIRHLAQLLTIADDIFGAIDNECRNVIQRTRKLGLKINLCQEVVDTLNAKTVPVPISTLSGNQLEHHKYVSCHEKEINNSSIFFTFPRPTAVERLRHLADGPSPPVFIPSNKVAPEADGEPGTVSSSSSTITHIYCQPLPVTNHHKSRSSVNSSDLDSTLMSSAVKSSAVPSNVIPIDVSGQPFSRMASFRRSLIHVDFLIRRKKKKDKRRNTVTEGDRKEIKEVLHNIINDEKQNSVRNNTIKSFQTISSKSKIDCNSEIQNENDSIKKDVYDEKNNNSSNGNFFEDSNCVNTLKICNGTQEQGKAACDKNGGIKLDLKKNPDYASKLSFPNKKKPKSNIPISTVSAAMSVAVEMRQLDGNKSEDQSSSGNWSCSSDHNSSDSEHKPRSREIGEFVSSAHANTSLTENYIDYKNRLKSKTSVSTYLQRKISNKENKSTEETASSCDSSEIDTRPLRDDISSNAPSTESDAFYISSDESDEELSNTIFYQTTCRSSTSLSTISDGSLNSLLSQTGTELASSSGTLTSVGLERLPTPPPPPPSIMAATRKEVSTDAVSKSTTSDKSFIIKKDKNHSNLSPKSTKKSKPMHKMLKPKIEKLDQQKNSVQSSKNIFTSLVNIKSPAKDQQKPKQKECEYNKLNKDQVLAPFDMYGNSSPKKLKQIPAFIKENISPVLENVSKNHLQSFCTVQERQESNVQHENSKQNSNSNTYKKLSDAQVSKGNIEIPLKYVHQVTVTPVQRCIINEASGILDKQPPIKENHNEKQICDCNTKSNFYPNGTITEGIHVYPSIMQTKPQRPTILQSEKAKLAARVVLDPEGRVIYSTNSLDRKHTDVRPMNHIKLKSFEPLPSDNEDTYPKQNSFYIQNHFHHSNTVPAYMETKFHNCKMANIICNPSPISSPNFKQDVANMDQFYPIYESFPKSENHVQILPSNSVKLTKRYSVSDSCELFRPNHCCISKQNPVAVQSVKSKETVNYLHNRPLDSLSPDPNISGLPINETLLTQHNVHLHSKHMEMLSRTPQNSCSTNPLQNSLSPSSLEMNYKSSENQNMTKSPLSTMSTEDLFTVIHNCKKRMNIKTDSDISLASSSRSSSPSYIRPASTKGTLAETGFLSPRNLSANYDNMRERRSWADFRPTSVSSDRKSLACDRLGPAKPTSMHDFKMLLLQTRSNSQVPGPRKSAVELLKIPVSYENSTRMNSMPLSLSPRNSISFSVQNSPTSEPCFYSGHSTVPFKRGNRARASLQSRYTMYPPIFEDCLEDSESCRDLLQPSTAKDLMPVESMKGNNQYRNNVHNTIGDNTIKHVRQWV